MCRRTLPFTVYPKKTKILAMFLICAAFVAIAVFVVREDTLTFEIAR